MIDYLLNVFIFICINSILAITLNFILGYAGIFSLAHAAFYGLSAYVTANAAIYISPNFFVGTSLAIIICALFSILLALPALRVRGEYFIAASLGLQIIAVSVFSDWKVVTGGIGGLIGIPAPTMFGYQLNSPLSMAVLSFVCLIVIILAITALVRTSFGRNLMAIRDSESASATFGKDVSMIKVISVAISSGLVAVAGALYAYYIRFVNVESFTLETSILIIAMVIIGGTGTILGPIIGAFLLTILPTVISYIPNLPQHDVGSIQQIIYGMAMILLMIFKPDGLRHLISKKRVDNE